MGSAEIDEDCFCALAYYVYMNIIEFVKLQDVIFVSIKMARRQLLLATSRFVSLLLLC